jgi:hypothetical protein
MDNLGNFYFSNHIKLYYVFNSIFLIFIVKNINIVGTNNIVIVENEAYRSKLCDKAPIVIGLKNNSNVKAT